MRPLDIVCLMWRLFDSLFESSVEGHVRLHDSIGVHCSNHVGAITVKLVTLNNLALGAIDGIHNVLVIVAHVHKWQRC